MMALSCGDLAHTHRVGSPVVGWRAGAPATNEPVPPPEVDPAPPPVEIPPPPPITVPGPPTQPPIRGLASLERRAATRSVESL